MPISGVMSGAISIAPMMTASEFIDRPSTAMTTDKASITMNRNHQWPTRPASGYSSAKIRRRSAGASAARVCHHRRDRAGVPSALL